MTDIVDKKHARLGPSGAAWWSTCPGAPAMTAGMPNTSSIYADKGTVMHEVASFCLWDDVLEEPYSEPQNAEAYVGRNFIMHDRETGEITREIEFDMSMADTVNEYCSHVHSLVDLTAGDVLMVEIEVPIDHITGEEGATGTSDVIAIVDGGETLLVVDLKTGSGVRVEAEDNDQCGMYGSGSLRSLPKDVAAKIKRVTGMIIQPPLGHVSETTWTVEELAERDARLSLAAELVREADILWAVRATPEELADSGLLNPSEKACKFCKAKATCPALLGMVVETVAPALASKFPNLDQSIGKELAAEIVPPVDEDDERLVQVWKARNLIQGYLTAVEAEIDRRLYAGVDVPGMGLFIGRAGNRAYSDEDEAEKILKASRLGADAIYTKKLISPAAAEKLLKKDKPRIWKKLDEVISQSEGKPTADLSTCGKTPFVVKIVEPTDFPNLAGELDDDDDLLN